MAMKRIMFYVWALLIMMGMCVEDECFISIIMVLGGAIGMWDLCRGMSKEQVLELAGVYWLEKKTGWNLTGDEVDE